jgi:hypothetical protein
MSRSTNQTPLDVLTEHFGQQLQGISPQEKCMIIAAFADHLRNHKTTAFRESLNYQDIDGELPELLVDCLRDIADHSDPVDVAAFMCALSAQIALHVKQGELD